MIKTSIRDGGNGLESHVRESEGPDPINGIVVYPLNVDAELFKRRIVPLTNPSFGAAMNINGAVSGAVSERMHDGTDTSLWTGSAIGGSWDFASTDQAQIGTKSIDGTSANNNHEALLTSASPIHMASWETLSFGIYVTGWGTGGTKEIELRVRASGANIGNTIDVSSYIDNTLFNSWQTAIIPKADFGLTTQSINEMVIKNIDQGGGPAPNFYMDEIQILGVASGEGPTTFSVAPEKGEWMYVSNIHLSLAGPLASSANDTVALSYNALLNVPELSNGLSVRQMGTEGTFAFTIKSLMDMIKIPNSKITSQGTDGTTTFVVIDVDRQLPIVMRYDQDHSMTIQINDDLSALTHFNIFVEAKIARKAGE